MAGTWAQYHGEAINPKHLSLWEVHVLGWAKNYDPKLDQEQKQAGVMASVKAAMARGQAEIDAAAAEGGHRDVDGGEHRDGDTRQTPVPGFAQRSLYE